MLTNRKTLLAGRGATSKRPDSSVNFADGTLPPCASLQRFCQPPSSLAQQFPSAFHLLLFGHAWARELADLIKQAVHLTISLGAPNNCKNLLAKFACHSRHACRGFSFERLPIQTPLACDRKID